MEPCFEDLWQVLKPRKAFQYWYKNAITGAPEFIMANPDIWHFFWGIPMRKIQRDGTTCKGRRVMCISVSSWATTKEDMKLNVEAMISCAKKE